MTEPATSDEPLSGERAPVALLGTAVGARDGRKHPPRKPCLPIEGVDPAVAAGGNHQPGPSHWPSAKSGRPVGRGRRERPMPPLAPGGTVHDNHAAADWPAKRRVPRDDDVACDERLKDRGLRVGERLHRPARPTVGNRHPIQATGGRSGERHAIGGVAEVQPGTVAVRRIEAPAARTCRRIESEDGVVPRHDHVVADDHGRAERLVARLARVPPPAHRAGRPVHGDDLVPLRQEVHVRPGDRGNASPLAGDLPDRHDDRCRGRALAAGQRPARRRYPRRRRDPWITSRSCRWPRRARWSACR